MHRGPTACGRRFRASRPQMRAQPLEQPRADAAHRQQVLDPTERPVLPALIEDAGRQNRTDSGQGVEFPGARLVEVQARLGCRLRS